MNWNLIFRLSLFGLVMAIGTVYFIPGNIEMLCWLLILIYCAYVIAKRAPGRYFWHGFVLSLANSVWVTSAHIIFADRYLAGHEEEMVMLANGPMPTHPRIMMALMGPVFGIIFGLILGLFAFIAGKVVKKKDPAPSAT
jgi:hypothetical protein